MKDPRFAKLVVFVNALVPLTLLLFDAYYHHLGANPTSYAIHTTGMLTLVFLVLSLTVTPLRKISGWNWLSHFRRMLGLFAFFYACLHFATYFSFDRSLNIRETIRDTLDRPFILYGMTGFILLMPLAATSTTGMIKRLGAANWKRLHRLAYVAGIAGAVHFWIFTKADKRLPLAFAIVLTMLLGYRLAAPYLPSLRRRPGQRATVGV